jgi:hypothetical protein
MPGGKGCFGVISFEEAEELKQQGWRAADLHVHTFCSYDVLPARPLHPEALYCRAKDAGLCFVTSSIFRSALST